MSTLPKSMDFSRVTSMTKMFANTIINVPLKINTASVTKMDGMFDSAKLNQKVSFTKETRPVSTARMFENTYFATGVSAPYLDTSGVTDMHGMFRGTLNLKTIPAYNTSQAKNLFDMFHGSSVSVFPSLDIPKAEYATYMFADAVIDAPLNINAPTVIKIDGMFIRAKLSQKVSFTQETTPFSTSRMFENTYFATGVSAPYLDTSEVTDMHGMFKGTRNLKTIPSYNTAKVHNLSEMFLGSSVSVIPDLNIPEAEYVTNMFANAVIDAPLNINAPSVTKMEGMFMRARLNQKVSFTRETRPKSVVGMFEEAYFAPDVSAPYIETSNVTNMKHMFKGTKNLKTIPAYNTSRVSNFFEMFKNSSISEVPVLDTSCAENTTGMFDNTSNLKDFPGLNMNGKDCVTHRKSGTEQDTPEQIEEKPSKQLNGAESIVFKVICIITLPVCLAVTSTASSVAFGEIAY